MCVCMYVCMYVHMVKFLPVTFHEGTVRKWSVAPLLPKQVAWLWWAGQRYAPAALPSGRAPIPTGRGWVVPRATMDGFCRREKSLATTKTRSEWAITHPPLILGTFWIEVRKLRDWHPFCVPKNAGPRWHTHTHTRTRSSNQCILTNTGEFHEIVVDCLLSRVSLFTVEANWFRPLKNAVIFISGIPWLVLTFYLWQ
jgi:hypothetical protein